MFGILGLVFGILDLCSGFVFAAGVLACLRLEVGLVEAREGEVGLTEAAESIGGIIVCVPSCHMSFLLLQ